MTAPVHFDCRYIRVDHHDGISRYSAGLFAALAKLRPLIAIINDERQLEHLPDGTSWVKLNDPTSTTEALAALKLNRLGATKVYSPMQTIGSFGRRFKLVLTLHDLIYYRHPTPPPSMPIGVRIGWRLFHLWYGPQRLLLNGSDAVVTVSKTTAGLIAQHSLTKRPVTVVYNGSAAQNATPANAPRTRPTDSQKLVYMGSFMGYKNVQTLVRGLAQLPGYELHLLSRISEAGRQTLMDLVQTGGGTVVFHNGISEAAYQQLLGEAVALVHASQDEGFGIPLVEAMSLGTPIVVSDIPIFHEIGGAAARFFAPADARAFADAVRGLEASSAWREASEAGLLQAQKFSWQQSAQTLDRLLEKL